MYTEVISGRIAITQEQKIRSKFFKTATDLLRNNKHKQLFEEVGQLIIEDPQDAEMWNLYGLIVIPLHGLKEGVMAFRRAVEIKPDYWAAWQNLAATLANLNLLAEAVQAYQMSLARHEDAQVRSDYLFILQKLEPNLELTLPAHLEFGEIYGNKKYHTFKNAPLPFRKLRIGYVSGDLREHSVAFFIEPILIHHDHQNFEIHAFSNGPEDYVTSQLKYHFDKWHDVRKLNDEAMTKLVRSLKIDILVDLSGHTYLNRLPVFGKRAAPVQVTWFGYLATTGLSEIDYRLTDKTMSSVEDQRYYTEKLYFLDTVCVWSPAREAPPVSPPPFSKSGHITFASINNIAKVNDAVLTTWAQLMDEVRDAVLVFVTGNSQEAIVQDRIRPYFDKVGAADRLVFIDTQPLAKFLGLFENFDICLDPFPYNGGTTTMHTLWAGVPIVTLSGTTEFERAGSHILRQVGLEQLVATTPDEYVRIAADLARSPQKLQELRNEMRDRLRAAPIMNAAALTKNLESAYRDMFARYCEQQTPQGQR